ncbi:MAG: glutathione S-transferase N-terminal domain-containing protein [Alphaproteobacteria bacterium]
MRLFMTPGSPYARIVRIQAIELGLAARIENVPSTLRDPKAVVLPYSPLGRVPVLEADDGLALGDTKTICAYLDRLHVGPPFVAVGGANLWQERAFEAFAIGFLDGIIHWGRELARPPEAQSAHMRDAEAARARRCLDHLEGRAGTLSTAVAFGPVTLLSALAYLDRVPTGTDWRDGRPGLGAWFETMAARPSFAATAPPPKA